MSRRGGSVARPGAASRAIGATSRSRRGDEPKDAIEHPTVIFTPNAARLVGQHRLDGGPFIIAEFVAHDSRLRFRSLAATRHGRGGAANALNLLPLSAELRTWPGLLLTRPGRE